MIGSASRRSVDSPDASAAGSLVSARARALAALVLACLAALLAGAAPSGAQEADRAPGRVLLISVPGLTWAEVQDHDLPAIEGLLEGSALADMAPRGVSPRATPGAAYLTISAGSRATSDPLVDGQQLALGEQAAGSSAGDVFERRTGVEPDGRYVALAWPTLERVNARQPYDAVLGLLTDTLDDAELGVEAIGNADGTDTVGTSYERQVGLAAATGDGVIPAGELDADLLTRDPSRPFGQRLDLDKVIQRFDRAWGEPAGRDGGLVVVEASDLARSMRYRDRVDLARYEDLRSQALEDTDDLVARLLARVDPERDTVLMVAPYNLPDDRNLTVAALRGPGIEPGYLRSASTQRSGFLTLVDVAPTVLDQLGVARPVEMEGRPAEAVASGASLDDRIDRLVALNEASRFRERLLFPTTLAVVVVLAGLCAATVVVLVRGGPPRARAILAFVALADLAVLPMSYVARAFPLEDLGAGFYWAFLVATGLLVAAVATLAGRAPRRGRLALVAVLALVLAVPLADVMLGSHLSLSAAFGYSPTGNSRLYGISNYAFGQVAAASCLLAALVASRWPSRRGRAAAIGLLAAVLVVIGMPTWGSDVGGIIAFTPTILVFAALVTGYRLRLRTVLIGLAVTAISVTAFGLVDLARPEGERAHLGRLFERVGDEGLEPLLSIMERKLLANLRVTTTSFWIAAIPVAIAFLIFLARYPTRPLAEARSRIPTLQAGVTSAIVAGVLGSLVNDSGAIVGGVTLTVIAVALAWLALETATTRASARPPEAEPSLPEPQPAPAAADAEPAPAPAPANGETGAGGTEPSPEEAPVRAGTERT
jgi:hypothetical protein